MNDETATIESDECQTLENFPLNDIDLAIRVAEAQLRERTDTEIQDLISGLRDVLDGWSAEPESRNRFKGGFDLLRCLEKTGYEPLQALVRKHSIQNVYAGLILCMVASDMGLRWAAPNPRLLSSLVVCVLKAALHLVLHSRNQERFESVVAESSLGHEYRKMVREMLPAYVEIERRRLRLPEIQKKGAKANKDRSEMMRNRIRRMTEDCLKNPQTYRWTAAQIADYIYERVSAWREGKAYTRATVTRYVSDHLAALNKMLR